MLDKKNGFAVGDNGLILKRQTINGAQIVVTTMPLSIYSNPATDYLIVNFKAEKPITIRWQITSERGNIVLVQPARLFNKGTQSVSLSFPDLPRGTYHVNAVNYEGEIVGAGQLIVIH